MESSFGLDLLQNLLVVRHKNLLIARVIGVKRFIKNACENAKLIQIVQKNITWTVF